jgi:predicted metal-dependent phosphotriesterase family hydrolase
MDLSDGFRAGIRRFLKEAELEGADAEKMQEMVLAETQLAIEQFGQAKSAGLLKEATEETELTALERFVYTRIS